MQKMSKVILRFDNIKVTKSACHSSKYPTDINEIDIKKILIFDKVLYGKKGFKYFNGYKNHGKIKPFCIMLPKIIGYVKYFDEIEYTPFLIKDEELLELYSKIWNKFINLMKKEFDSEPVYNA